MSKDEIVYYACGDVAVHSGHVQSVPVRSLFPEGSVTEQSIAGAHGTVLYSGPDKVAAQEALDEFLVCDAPETGRCCYAHNPAGGR